MIKLNWLCTVFQLHLIQGRFVLCGWWLISEYTDTVSILMCMWLVARIITRTIVKISIFHWLKWTAHIYQKEAFYAYSNQFRDFVMVAVSPSPPEFPLSPHYRRHCADTRVIKACVCVLTVVLLFILVLRGKQSSRALCLLANIVATFRKYLNSNKVLFWNYASYVLFQIFNLYKFSMFNLAKNSITSTPTPAQSSSSSSSSPQYILILAVGM